MKCFTALHAVLLALSLSVAAPALLMAQPVKLADVAVGRLHIAQERQHQQRVFAQTEKACYRRFAVSDCLREARQSRRSALDELHRQEIVLNDEERQAKGAEALRRIDNNMSSQNPANHTP